MIQLLICLNSSENFKYPEEFYLNRMKKEKSQLNFNDYDYNLWKYFKK